MDELRSVFTVISLLTFVLIVAWACSPSFRGRSDCAVGDLMSDDDRNHVATATGEQHHG